MQDSANLGHANEDVEGNDSETNSFKKGNYEFKHRWYFLPVKYLTLTLVTIGYLLSVAMFLLPFVGWYLENFSLAFAGAFTLLFSPHTFMYARKLHKDSNKYFIN
jgi:uncharacterized RDD family membrane protein YckC